MKELRMVNGRIYSTTDRLPWCPNCEHYAPPTDAGECGDCGTEIVWKSSSGTEDTVE